ncbi:hypothetical protein [Orenia marismortui]|uniref:hypothetical protein n=1 Tax=Orenia marismortui TaxID=46469 RepID=UPI00036D1EDE|nr:hypothetical protein [Orenia marismortui]
MSTKIEQAKKKLGNLWVNKQITDQEYRQAIDQLENRAKKYTSTKSIQKEEIVKAPKVPEVNIENTKDIDHFKNGVLIPRNLYDLNKLKFSSKSMYSAFYILCKHSNKNGRIIGLTTSDMAHYYGYSDSRNVRNGLDKLEGLGLITINRNVKPYIYTINNYNFKSGGFVVPEEVMKDVSHMKLKQLRIQWLYMCRNLHSPKNKSKSDLSLGHIRKMVNADCYKEVIELARSLTDKFFTAIKEVKKGFWRSWNSLKVSFNNATLGIIENVQNKLESYKSHHLYNHIKNIFERLDIKLCALNFKSAIDLMDEYTERELLIVKQNIDNDNLDKSYSGSAGYLRHLLQRARNGALVAQY